MVNKRIAKVSAVCVIVLFLLFGGAVIADRILLVKFDLWRKGTVVAEASFDPGIAPFTIEVRKVPVPVTQSHHFIVSLFRGQYVVTSFRYFWPGYTPEKVHIEWPCVNRFTVTFDDKYEAICEWAWGREAKWSMNVQGDGEEPGLSAYFFTPAKPVPDGCPVNVQ